MRKLDRPHKKDQIRFDRYLTNGYSPRLHVEIVEMLQISYAVFRDKSDDLFTFRHLAARAYEDPSLYLGYVRGVDDFFLLKGINLVKFTR